MGKNEARSFGEKRLEIGKEHFLSHFLASLVLSTSDGKNLVLYLFLNQYIII